MAEDRRDGRWPGGGADSPADSPADSYADPYFDSDPGGDAGADSEDDAIEPAPGRDAGVGQDLTVSALEAARGMVAGEGAPGSYPPRPGSGAAKRAAARRRRRRYSDGPTYSGARPDDRDPVRIGAVVGKAIPDLGWVGPLAEARLMSQWATVVGEDIAARCHPVSLVEGDLKVVAESTAWATQLRLMAPQILAKITADLPRGLVRRVTITGPSGPSFKRGPWSMRGGRGVRDTYG